ncbi:MAG: fused MFS/spermidine synthase [Saprospiraceae bacterium]|nr:fused MFS/spermidine synthase [Saprospiraceae bacterium]
MKQPNARYLYFLSFLEGGCVMACELIGAKMLAPYFGTSLYVWASALGITLGGLMSGYFLGGIVSRRISDNLKVLYMVLVAAAAFLFLMPFTSDWVMNAALGLGLQAGASVSLFIFMFPPLVFMGMVSPLIINLLTQDAKGAGNSAGNVYAISTLGGILMTFLLGFYIIPEFGISRPAMVSGFLLGVLPGISLLRSHRNIAGTAVLLCMAVLGLARPPHKAADTAYKTIYYTEGIMGQLKVIDIFMPENGRNIRGLIVNNTLQTMVDLSDPEYDYWAYPRLIQYFAAAYPEGSRALVLGMGGGTLVRRLDSLHLDLDVVEIDKRISEAAVDYFGLGKGYNIIIDDARHVVRTAVKSYDLIIYDAFKGESAPEHVLTQEGIEEARKAMAPGGVIFINFYGYLDGDLGLLTRSVAKTLQSSGLQVQLFATPGEPDQRNIVLAAWPQGAPSPLDREVSPGRRLPLSYHPQPLPEPDWRHALVLTDERPQLHLFARAAMQWRLLFNKYLLQKN